MLKKILHLTPHMGGGPGNVITSFISFEIRNNSDNIYSIATLDYANDNAKKFCLENKIELFENVHKDIGNFLKIISNYDIILVHFWNHPLLYDFIVRNELPKCRIIFWTHTAGFSLPSIFSKKLLSYPDLVVFSSPISFETNEVKNYINKSKLISISSTSGTSRCENIVFESHEYFTVLYIGTVDFSKMYPNFLKLCSKINIPDIKFIVCGGPNHKELEIEAKKLGIDTKIEFLGRVNNIEDYIKISDIFGYPLTKNHYGTTDQVLIEAMSAGLVPIVFDNPMEKYMVKNGLGFICTNEEEYVKAVETLYKDKKLKEKMSKNVKKYALEEYSIEKMLKKWNKVFNDLINIEKTEKIWDIQSKNNLTTFDIFLESIGDYKNIFKLNNNNLKEELSKDIWNSNSTGSIKQYKLFLDDGSLDNYII